MRIIYNPNPAEEIVRICQECKCKFAYTEGDIKTYVYSNEILGPGYYGYRKRYIICPNCGKEIIIEEKSTSERDSMYDEPINIKCVEPESLGPDIEEITMFPHLTNPDEEDGE